MARKRKRAAPRTAARAAAEPTGMILRRVFDGTHKPVAVNRTCLARLLDGSQREQLARDLSEFNPPFTIVPEA